MIELPRVIILDARDAHNPVAEMDARASAALQRAVEYKAKADSASPLSEIYRQLGMAQSQELEAERFRVLRDQFAKATVSTFAACLELHYLLSDEDWAQLKAIRDGECSRCGDPVASIAGWAPGDVLRTGDYLCVHHQDEEEEGVAANREVALAKDCAA